MQYCLKERFHSSTGVELLPTSAACSTLLLESASLLGTVLIFGTLSIFFTMEPRATLRGLPFSKGLLDILVEGEELAPDVERRHLFARNCLIRFRASCCTTGGWCESPAPSTGLTGGDLEYRDRRLLEQGGGEGLLEGCVPTRSLKAVRAASSTSLRLLCWRRLLWPWLGWLQPSRGGDCDRDRDALYFLMCGLCVSSLRPAGESHLFPSGLTALGSSAGYLRLSTLASLSRLCPLWVTAICFGRCVGRMRSTTSLLGRLCMLNTKWLGRGARSTGPRRCFTAIVVGAIFIGRSRFSDGLDSPVETSKGSTLLYSVLSGDFTLRYL